MVALTSVLRDRWVRTRALYSASFCRRKADGSADFARKRSDNMISPFHLVGGRLDGNLRNAAVPCACRRFPSGRAKLIGSFHSDGLIGRDARTTSAPGRACSAAPVDSGGASRRL